MHFILCIMQTNLLAPADNDNIQLIITRHTNQIIFEDHYIVTKSFHFEGYTKREEKL